MEKAKGIYVPIYNDYVLSPKIIYSSNITCICFNKAKEGYGRITFDKLDSLKVSRGENIPFHYDWNEDEPDYWIYQVENSKWLKERYKYEKTHYGNCYEFGGNVEEMITDFKHYLFQFHDEFIEVISRGFWYETDNKPLNDRPLMKGHPDIILNMKNSEKRIINGVNYKIVFNHLSKKEIEENSKFYRQKLFEFYKEDSTSKYPDFFINVKRRNNDVISSLSCLFKNEIYTEKGIINLNRAIAIIEKELKNEK